MTDNWIQCKWGDLASIEYGRALRGYESGNGPYPVYGTNGCIGRHFEALSKNAGVIIGRKGAYRGIHYSKEPFFVIDTAFYLKPKTNIDIRWAYYELLTHDINNMDSGSAIPSTSREDFYNLPVILPSLIEQKAIAHMLGLLDDKIDLINKINVKLEKILELIFQHWFIDFEFPNEEGKPYQSSGGEMIDSELGEIPKDWKVMKISDVANVNERNIGSCYSCETIEYIDISSVVSGTLLNTVTYNIKDAPSRAKRLVNHGDIIWSTVRPNRKSYLFIHSPQPNLVVSTGFAVITPKQLPPSYLYSYVTTDEFVAYLSASADGSAYPAIRSNIILDAKLIVPPPRISKLFDSVASPTIDLSWYNNRQFNVLSSIRDSLIPKLLSGEIRV